MAGSPQPPKRRYKPGAGEKFDPKVHLDLRFGQRRKNQLGRVVGGDVHVTPQEFARMKNKPEIHWPEKGKIVFVNKRRYPILSAGRRKEDRTPRKYDHE
jgi:hypothetical protein